MTLSFGTTASQGSLIAVNATHRFTLLVQGRDKPISLRPTQTYYVNFDISVNARHLFRATSASHSSTQSSFTMRLPFSKKQRFAFVVPCPRSKESAHTHQTPTYSLLTPSSFRLPVYGNKLVICQHAPPHVVLPTGVTECVSSHDSLCDLPTYNTTVHSRARRNCP